MARMERLLVLVARVYYWISIVFGIIGGIALVAVGALLVKHEVRGVHEVEWLNLLDVLQTGSIVLGILYIISSIGAIMGLRRRNIWLLLQFVVYDFIAAACCVAYVIVFTRKLEEEMRRDDKTWKAYLSFYNYGSYNGVYYGYIIFPILLICSTLILYQDFNRQKKLQREQSAANSKTESPLGYPSSFSPNGSEPYPKANSTTKAYA